MWDEEKQEWFFSVVDIVAVLTESANPRRYWSDLKRKMSEEEGAVEVYEKIVQLKMLAPNGKKRETDAADMTGIFHIIQSIPSPKAEPFKMWLAEVGKERIDEIIDPELTIDRALETYLKKGLDENKQVAQRGGTVAGNARKEIEAQTGKPVLSRQNAVDFAKLIEDVAK